MIIYCLENIINGKKYIGQTVQPLLSRVSSHFSSVNSKRRGCPFIRNAIKKYGKDNFKYCIIDSSAKNQLELNILENKYILEFNTLFPNGYNAHFTDINRKSRVLNSHTRKRMSNNMKEINKREEREKINYMAGKTNLGKKRKNAGSKLTWVKKRRNIFIACSFLDGITTNIGTYNTEIEAGIAVDYFIINNHKNLYHLINFQENIEKYLKKEIPEPIKNKSKKNSNSKYYGVGFSKRGKKWVARIFKYKRIEKYIGLFNTEIEAAQAYNNKVKELNLDMPLNIL